MSDKNNLESHCSENVVEKLDLGRYAFFKGYLQKIAGVPPVTIPVMASIMFPYALATSAAHASSALEAPPRSTLKKLQAEFVKRQLEHALAQLEETRKLEVVKQSLGSVKPSVRI